MRRGLRIRIGCAEAREVESQTRHVSRGGVGGIAIGRASSDTRARPGGPHAGDARRARIRALKRYRRCVIDKCPHDRRTAPLAIAADTPRHRPHQHAPIFTCGPFALDQISYASPVVRTTRMCDDSLCRRLHRPPHDLTQTIMPMPSAMIRSSPCRM